MRSKQYFTSIKNNPHEISTDPILSFPICLYYLVDKFFVVDLTDEHCHSKKDRKREVYGYKKG